MSFKVKEIQTQPYNDQLMGTSGLRKKVKVFQQQNYPENFLQSYFDCLKKEDYEGKSLIIGGDGRYYNDQIIHKSIKIAAAHKISKILLAKDGLMSTPALSLLIRKQPKDTCMGALVITSSHNPGGPDNDMGVKINAPNGGAIQEYMNKQIFEKSKEIKRYFTVDIDKEFSFTQADEFSVTHLDNSTSKIAIEIVDTTENYIAELKELFDFDLIKSLFARKDFHFVFDAFHGVGGPYGIKIFNEIFGVPLEDLHNCNTLPDFGGLHPDPNLTTAKDLVEQMDIFNKKKDDNIPDFGCAVDGDADRNMVLGSRTFISPCDSLAMVLANSKLIKSFEKFGGVKGVARSLPTSGAVDLVAKALNIPVYEVPTGWKFFANLLDSNMISLCGEESFGLGSQHAREKDGLWAVFCWLTILAQKNKDNSGKLIGIKDIVSDFLKTYGRTYYCRYDFENLTMDEFNKVIETLTSNFESFEKMGEGNKAYIFNYTDPVDKQESKNQGWILKFGDGSRICFRKSGTSSTGATLRVYFEKYMKPDGELFLSVADGIKTGVDLPEMAYKLTKVLEISGRKGPDVIT